MLTSLKSEIFPLAWRCVGNRFGVMRAVCICLTLFAVSCLVEEALCRRMSLRVKRKKTLRKYLEKEARLRNDTLMQRLLLEQSSNFDPTAPNKPTWPKSYEDISHYTLSPNLVPGTNESSLDNSDWVHEMVPDLKKRRKPKTTRSTTVKRNRTTSKYKKKLDARSSTTLHPEAVEALRNFTIFSFLDLTPFSIEANTDLPFPHENLDPKYYTYRSKAWTTTNATNSTTVASNLTSPVSPGGTDDYQDFDSPATRYENVDQTLSKLTADYSKVLDFVKEYENRTHVVGEETGGTVDKTNGNAESKVRNLISSIDNLILKDSCLLNDTEEALNKDLDDIVHGNEKMLDTERLVQYNYYDERDMRDRKSNSDTKQDKSAGNDIDLIEDILVKYCRENPTEFEANLKKDAYYLTLRSVLKLFVKEMLSKKSTKNADINVDDAQYEHQSAHTETTENGNQTCWKSLEKNNENEAFQQGTACEDANDIELETMKPHIHREKEVIVDTHYISTVKYNFVTETYIERTADEESSQHTITDITNDFDGSFKNASFCKTDDKLANELEEHSSEDSSLNNKVLAEYLLKNKLKDEISRVNNLIDELNEFNTSIKYEHILVEQNASLHELVENLRRKRSKSEEDYVVREEAKRTKKGGRHRPVKATGKPETASKEKYYYPKWPTHDPGDELWKQVKRDYETNPKVRKVIDTSYIHEEKFNSRMWRKKEREWDFEELEKTTKKKKKKRETRSEAEYDDREYVRKMKADFKKQCLTDESPETTEGTTMDTKFLDLSRSRRKGGPIDIKDLGLSNPSEFARRLKKRDLLFLNQEDVFERYDPADSHFVEDLAQHVRRKRHARKRADKLDGQNRHVCQPTENKNDQNPPDINGGILVRKIRQVLAKHRHRRNVDPRHEDIQPRPELPQENVPIDQLEYDMYHGLKYGITEVAEEEVDLTGLYTRYTAASVGPYQKKRYDQFRDYFLAASSTWRDPFVKVSFAICPFCGDYFGSHDKMRFHADYMHFNIISTVVPVTAEPTSTIVGATKEKDINDIFEAILKDGDLAEASEKWGDYIHQNVHPTRLQEYKNLLFNESVTAYLTVPVHLDLMETKTTIENDECVKVLAYPSEYHEKENLTYPKDLLKSNRKSIPVVNLYQNPEAFMKKLINHEPLLSDDEQEKQVLENLMKKSKI